MISQNNRLFELARLARRLPPWYVAVILAVIFIAGGSILGAIPAALLLYPLGGLQTAQNPLIEAVRQLILLLAVYVPVYLLVFLWMWFYEKRKPWTAGLENRRPILHYLRGAVVGLFLIGMAVIVPYLFGAIQFQPVPTASSPGVWLAVFVILPGWLVQGSGEELLTRGWLMPVIGARYSPMLGIIISSLLFALLHTINPNLNPVAILNLFLFGVFAALYALSEGSVWGIFALHATWNWAEGNLFGVPVSGMPFQGIQLLTFRTVSAPLLTGGDFGPEGGLAVTMILLVGIILVSRLLIRKSRQMSETPRSPV